MSRYALRVLDLRGLLGLDGSHHLLLQSPGVLACDRSWFSQPCNPRIEHTLWTGGLNVSQQLSVSRKVEGRKDGGGGLGVHSKIL